MLFYGLPIGDMATFEFRYEKWRTPQAEKLFESESEITSMENQKISVMKILQDTVNGKQILKYYENNRILHEEHRSLLIDTISKYVESKGLKVSISQCFDMEKEICSIFPSEELVSITSIFIIYFFYNKNYYNSFINLKFQEYYNTGKRGKLYNKIFNLKRVSRSIFKSEVNDVSNTPEKFGKK